MSESMPIIAKLFVSGATALMAASTLLSVREAYTRFVRGSTTEAEPRDAEVADDLGGTESDSQDGIR